MRPREYSTYLVATNPALTGSSLVNALSYSYNPPALTSSQRHTRTPKGDSMIDFSIPPELETVRERTRAFMYEFVYPNEDKLVEDEGLPIDLEAELQTRVKAMGLWAPNLPTEWGGMGIGFIGQALMNEIIGRSVFAPRLFGNAAPDAGNSELLLIAATH